MSKTFIKYVPVRDLAADEFKEIADSLGVNYIWLNAGQILPLAKRGILPMDAFRETQRNAAMAGPTENSFSYYKIIGTKPQLQQLTAMLVVINS